MADKIYNWQNFDELFGFDLECAYGAADVQTIQSNRTALEDLFVEKVLKLMGIKRSSKFYPPKSHEELKSLHKAIVDSSAADHHKISVLYYILLDFDAPTGRRDLSDEFEKRSFLPRKYQIYMKGLWHLDRLGFETSLQYLTHPSLIPTFADEILIVLVRHAKQNDLSLALAYYHSVQPALTQQAAIEALFSAIARTTVTEAFYFCRSQPEHAQQHLFGMLTALALTNQPNTSTAERSLELVNLPMTQQEEAWFEEYLLRGEGRPIQNGKSALMMRRIGTGKIQEASVVKGMANRAIGGLDWSSLLATGQKGLGPRASS